MFSRIDAYEKVTGKAVYADDISLPNMLYAKQVYSEHPHAKILKIDTSEAKKLKGVIDIITAEECPGSKTFGQIEKDFYILAYGKVRCMGDVIAVAAAENKEAASAAAKLIKVEYEPLKPVLNPFEALKSDSPKVHDDKAGNVVHSYKIRHGNAEKIFSANEKVFEAEFQTQYVEHAYLEPESCVAISNPDDTITVYGCMQHPFTTRKFVSAFLGLPLNKVQIIQTTVGGAFGGKDDTISAICARAALLALRTKRPVKITLTREESIRESYKRHPFNIKLKMAVDHGPVHRALPCPKRQMRFYGCLFK
ncbi:MAG: xanthine dehydrogenase family protein molybdopterin-binding subunit [Deltaproteobacteria bacterium]|nr:xanthine dehydrogenase family protein molybdopterin-binding subunit [Deltaproteobacteria bacterium]